LWCLHPACALGACADCPAGWWRRRGHGRWSRPIEGAASTGRHALPGPRFTLLRLHAPSATWQAPLSTPATSLTSICGLGPAETWALGAEHLGRWRAGTWEDIAPPAPIDHRSDRLFALDGGAVLATRRGLHLWRDAQSGWGHRDVDGIHVRGLASPFIAARGAGGAVRIGRLDGAWVDWLGQVQGGADVVRFTWAPWPGVLSARRAMQLLLVPHDTEAHQGLVLVRSQPGGGFAVMRLSVPPDGAWAGVAGAAGLLAISADRRPIQLGDPQ
jgi:hypothetical protein